MLNKTINKYVKWESLLQYNQILIFLLFLVSCERDMAASGSMFEIYISNITDIFSGWEVQILWIISACIPILEILNGIYHLIGITLGTSFLYLVLCILLSVVSGESLTEVVHISFHLV